MIDPQDRQSLDRRETMLEELIVAMRRHHARRRAIRTAGAWALLLAVAGGTLVVRAQQAGLRPQLADRGDVATQIDRSVPRIVHVPSEHRTGLVRIIDDDELVQRLEEIDRPAGLVRTEGRAWLTSAVIDAELGTPEAPEPTL